MSKKKTESKIQLLDQRQPENKLIVKEKPILEKNKSDDIQKKSQYDGYSSSQEQVEAAIKTMKFRQKRGTRMKDLISGKLKFDYFWQQNQKYFGGNINCPFDEDSDDDEYQQSSSGRDQFDSDFDQSDSYPGKRGRRKANKTNRKKKTNKKIKNQVEPVKDDNDKPDRSKNEKFLQQQQRLQKNQEIQNQESIQQNLNQDKIKKQKQADKKIKKKQQSQKNDINQKNKSKKQMIQQKKTHKKTENSTQMRKLSIQIQNDGKNMHNKNIKNGKNENFQMNSINIRKNKRLQAQLQVLISTQMKVICSDSKQNSSLFKNNQRKNSLKSHGSKQKSQKSNNGKGLKLCQLQPMII